MDLVCDVGGRDGWLFFKIVLGEYLGRMNRG